jgi:hypothetical protein
LCGLCENLCYVSGTADYSDNCSMDTFARIWIEDLIRQLGHEITSRTHVYWSPHGKDLLDGLSCVESDADIVAMASSL